MVVGITNTISATNITRSGLKRIAINDCDELVLTATVLPKWNRAIPLSKVRRFERVFVFKALVHRGGARISPRRARRICLTTDYGSQKSEDTDDRWPKHQRAIKKRPKTTKYRHHIFASWHLNHWLTLAHRTRFPTDVNNTSVLCNNDNTDNSNETAKTRNNSNSHHQQQ